MCDSSSRLSVQPCSNWRLNDIIDLTGWGSTVSRRDWNSHNSYMPISYYFQEDRRVTNRLTAQSDMYNHLDILAWRYVCWL